MDRQRENCFMTEVENKFLPDFRTDMPKTSSDRLDFYLSGPTVRHISICLEVCFIGGRNQFQSSIVIQQCYFNFVFTISAIYCKNLAMLFQCCFYNFSHLLQFSNVILMLFLQFQPLIVKIWLCYFNVVFYNFSHLFKFLGQKEDMPQHFILLL